MFALDFDVELCGFGEREPEQRLLWRAAVHPSYEQKSIISSASGQRGTNSVPTSTSYKTKNPSLLRIKRFITGKTE